MLLNPSQSQFPYLYNRHRNTFLTASSDKSGMMRAQYKHFNYYNISFYNN